MYNCILALYLLRKQKITRKSTSKENFGVLSPVSGMIEINYTTQLKYTVMLNSCKKPYENYWWVELEARSLIST